MKEKGRISQEHLNQIMIKQEDFKEALKLVRPSAMREILVEKGLVTDAKKLRKKEMLEVFPWSIGRCLKSFVFPSAVAPWRQLNPLKKN